MKAFARILSALSLAIFCAACGGGGAAPPPPHPPPSADRSLNGLWIGTSLGETAADVLTDFEFTAIGGFSVGTPPYTATFSNGNAETSGDPAFHISGISAWHVLVGTTATVTFETMPNTLTLHVRTGNTAAVGEVDILDENGVLIQRVVPTEVFQVIDVSRVNGETLIGSVEITNINGGDVVVDDLTFGYSASGFSTSTDDVFCWVADSVEFNCILLDRLSGIPRATVQATVRVADTNQFSGSGKLYAEFPFTLANGKTAANLTMSGGTFSAGNSVDVTVDAAGITSSFTTSFHPSNSDGSNLADVAAIYEYFNISEEDSSLAISTTGKLSGQSTRGCVLDGQVTISDATLNVYDVALDIMDIANCSVPDGRYSGLGAMLRDAARGDISGDVFLFTVFTNQNGAVGFGVK